jgi:hypothetical protein
MYLMNDKRMLFKPQTEKECEKVVEIICKKRKENGR